MMLLWLEITYRNSPPSFLSVVDPVLNDTSREELVPVSLICAVPPVDGSCLFHTSVISLEMCVHIASYLRCRDRVKSMEVSNDFYNVMRSKYLWSEYLAHPDYRIWGATRWSLVHRSQGYQFTSADQIYEEDPFYQLRTYHELYKSQEAGPENEFFDYLARLMPGGPLAFKAIPQLNLPNAMDLKPEEMSASLMRGKDQQGLTFFAMRLVDREESEAKPIVLLFTRSGSHGPWVQQANAWWKENTLKVSYQDTLNYILTIIKCESLSARNIFLPPPFKKGVELV